MNYQSDPPSKATVQYFRKSLIKWGGQNYRSFPWRETRDPYKVLIAELLLHRTRASQVVDVYIIFIDQYPDIPALSRANRVDLETTLYSLGLFWRIDLIMDMSQMLMRDYNGLVPVSKVDLLSLPGVGDYIAGSVRCFAFGKTDAIIDTNVMRVIPRFYGIEFRDSMRRNKKFQDFTQQLVDPVYPREYNFALLDIANLICITGNPDCSVCPLQAHCSFSSIDQDK